MLAVNRGLNPVYLRRGLFGRRFSLPISAREFLKNAQAACSARF
jgi:hypothetical protein